MRKGIVTSHPAFIFIFALLLLFPIVCSIFPLFKVGYNRANYKLSTAARKVDV